VCRLHQCLEEETARRLLLGGGLLCRGLLLGGLLGGRLLGLGGGLFLGGRLLDGRRLLDGGLLGGSLLLGGHAAETHLRTHSTGGRAGGRDGQSAAGGEAGPGVGVARGPTGAGEGTTRTPRGGTQRETKGENASARQQQRSSASVQTGRTFVCTTMAWEEGGLKCSPPLLPTLCFRVSAKFAGGFISGVRQFCVSLALAPDKRRLGGAM
jgi:hypothetical protein